MEEALSEKKEEPLPFVPPTAAKKRMKKKYSIASAAHYYYDVTFSARRVYTTSGHYEDKDFINAHLTSFSRGFFTRFLSRFSFAVVAQYHRCQKYVRKIRLSSKKKIINRLMIVQISRVIVGACLSTYTITYETTTQHKVF